MDTASEKAVLRRKLRQCRKSLSKRERRCAEIEVCRRLKRFIKRGKRIALYWPIGSELRLDNVIKTARQRGAKIYLPYIEPCRLRLWFTPYRQDSRRERGSARSGLNIPQFQGNKIRAHLLHTMILPLVGMDKRGFRLGQGGGYYDVSLSHTAHRLSPLKIGVGFACQLVDSVPAEAHDLQADYFVCEHSILRF